MKLKLAAFAGALTLAMFTASGAMAQSCGDNSGNAATGEPIIIGAITGQTGPDDFSASTKGAKAYFDCVNANGGIHGRPIEYIIEDDQWNPEIASQLAAKLVNDDNAVMLVGSASFVSCGANAQFFADNNIIDLAGVGVPRECFFASHIAPTNAGPRVSMVGALGYAIDELGAENVVCMTTNIPGAGDWSCEGLEAAAEELGITSNSILMDPATGDFTSVVLQAASYGPDTVVLGFPKGLTIPILAAAEEQGLNQSITWTSAASAYDLTVPDTIGEGWDQAFYANMEFNDLNSEGEDNQNWLAVMDAYANADDPRDTFAQAGYLAARIAEQALNTLEADAINRDSVTAAVQGVEGFESDIFCTPWYFADGLGRNNANWHTRMAVADGGEWTVISECAPSPDPQLDDVRAYEAENGLGAM